MRSFYGKLPETDFMKPIYRRLLASGFIRYARNKDGEISFKTTPAGRKVVQDVLDKQTEERLGKLEKHPQAEHLMDEK